MKCSLDWIIVNHGLILNAVDDLLRRLAEATSLVDVNIAAGIAQQELAEIAVKLETPA